MKILIMEDDVDTSSLLEELLKANNNEVFVADNGSDAIALAEDACPDLIVSDWQLRDSMSGVDACKIILQSCPDARVIFVSGSSREDVVQASKGLRPIACLSKPCDCGKLLEAVYRAQV